jgi:hypothetical protein
MAGWKICSELMRPIAGEPAWEFVERASNPAVMPFPNGTRHGIMPLCVAQ